MVKVMYYKSYNNKLNKIKKAVKHNYFKAQFELNKHQLKTMWKWIIGVLTNKTKNSQSKTLNKFIYKSKSYADQQSISNLLNTYFINAGCGLASNAQY